MDDEVDGLYALPLEEFTAARNALAKQRGDPEIKKLVKPTLSAWLLNQLARQQSEDIESLLHAGEQLRTAQEQALGGDASSLRDASRALHDEIARVAGLVADFTPAQRERMAATLQAAATGRQAGEQLRAGRLTADLEPSGFGLDEIEVPEPKRPTKDREAIDRRRLSAEAERLATEADRAGARAEKLSEAAGEAERRAVEARRAAESALDAASAARQKAEDARRLLRDASH